MKEDNYLKESVIKCVDYAMEQDDEAKRRIFTGLFEYCDKLVNEDILVTCLNDEQKRKWLHNELIDNLQARIDKAIRILNSAKNHYDNDKTNWAVERTLRVLKGSDNDDNS